MPSFSFSVFLDKVKSGEKTQTIRTIRKNMPKVGQTAYLYKGMRTKNCEKLGEGTITDVIKMKFEKNDVCVYPIFYGTDEHPDEIARKDGFENSEEMCKWFDKMYKLPMDFIIVRWELSK